MLKENKEKSQRTILEKYHVKNVMQNKEIRNRQNQSLYKKYGVYTPILNEDIKRKIQETKVKKYGACFTVNGMLLINGVFCSRAQKEICDKFNFEINKNIDKYWVDGCKDDLIIEYNGGGHDRSVKERKISKENFKIKEETRIGDLIDLNYHILIIENPNDLTITDYDYLQLENIIYKLKNYQKIVYKISGSTTIET